MKLYLKNLIFIIMLSWSTYSQGFMIKNESILNDNNYFTSVKLTTCELFEANYKKLLLNRYIYFNINNKYYALQNEEESMVPRKILFDLEKINNSIIFEYLGCEHSDNSLTFRIRENHSDTSSKFDIPDEIKKIKDFYHLKPTDNKFHLNLQDINFFVPEEGNFIKSMKLKNVHTVTDIKTCKDFYIYIQGEESHQWIYKIKSLGSYFKNNLQEGFFYRYDTLSMPQSFMWLQELKDKEEIFYEKCENDKLIFVTKRYGSPGIIKKSSVPLDDIIFYKYKSPIRSLDEIKDHLEKKIHSCEEFEEYIKAHEDENFIYFAFTDRSNSIYFSLLITKYNPNGEFSLVEKPYLFAYLKNTEFVGISKIRKYYTGCQDANLFFSSIYNDLSKFDLRKLRFFEHKLDKETKPDMSHSPKIEYGVDTHGKSFEMKELHGKNLYVTNYNDSTISEHHKDISSVELKISPTTVLTGEVPSGISISPDGKNVYVTNSSDDTISEYFRTSSGELRAFQNTSTGQGPSSISISPDGKNVYVINYNDNTISDYDSTNFGNLRLLNTTSTGNQPSGISINPNGKNVYVTNSNDNTISEYDRLPSGQLRLTQTTLTGNQPSSISISPDGKNVYVTNSNDNTISEYNRHPSGQLTLTGTTSTGNQPSSISISPNGKNVYVTNSNDNTISEYDRLPSGQLRLTQTISTGNQPSGITISPDGKNVYVTNSNDNTISGYDRYPYGGQLTISHTTISTGNQPSDITISPDGKNVYVTNSNDNTISEYDRLSSGRLRPLQTYISR